MIVLTVKSLPKDMKNQEKKKSRRAMKKRFAFGTAKLLAYALNGLVRLSSLGIAFRQLFPVRVNARIDLGCICMVSSCVRIYFMYAVDRFVEISSSRVIS